jgi:hypothetical protein
MAALAHSGRDAPQRQLGETKPSDREIDDFMTVPRSRPG